MALYAIGDLHLSLGPADKPMDVFGEGWKDYVRRIIGDEYVVEDVNGVKERFRRIIVFGTRRQIGELLDARDIIVNYCRH